MKNKSGAIIGFITGFAGFLLLFKIIFLDHTQPEDELAPGMVMIIAILTGLIFSYAGRRLQNYWGKESNRQ